MTPTQSKKRTRAMKTTIRSRGRRPSKQPSHLDGSWAMICTLADFLERNNMIKIARWELVLPKVMIIIVVSFQIAIIVVTLAILARIA